MKWQLLWQHSGSEQPNYKLRTQNGLEYAVCAKTYAKKRKAYLKKLIKRIRPLSFNDEIITHMQSKITLKQLLQESPGEVVFERILKKFHVEYKREYCVLPDSRHRSDFVLIAQKVIFEVEGGIWSKGRHIRPKGFMEDCKKYNQATALGWKLYRIPLDWLMARTISRKQARYMYTTYDVEQFIKGVLK